MATININNSPSILPPPSITNNNLQTTIFNHPKTQDMVEYTNFILFPINSHNEFTTSLIFGNENAVFLKSKTTIEWRILILLLSFKIQIHGYSTICWIISQSHIIVKSANFAPHLALVTFAVQKYSERVGEMFLT